MAIRILSTESVDGAITGNNIRTNTGNLFVGNGSNTTANIYGFGDSLMIQGVSGATYLRVSGTATLAGTLQAGQWFNWSYNWNICNIFWRCNIIKNWLYRINN